MGKGMMLRLFIAFVLVFRACSGTDFSGSFDAGALSPKAYDHDAMSEVHKHKQRLNAPKIREHAEEHWPDFDNDPADGKVTWAEFSVHFGMHGIHHSENIMGILPGAKKEFDAADTNRDGWLSKNEFHAHIHDHHKV